MQSVANSGFAAWRKRWNWYTWTVVVVRNRRYKNDDAKFNANCPIQTEIVDKRNEVRNAIPNSAALNEQSDIANETESTENVNEQTVNSNDRNVNKGVRNPMPNEM